MPLPRLSIVTVCRNSAATLETAMRSVLAQLAPGDEYIVIDGASTDGSLEIIRRHVSRLAYWISEPDRGQSDALNKGFARATGDVVGWLNADDLLLPGALEVVRRTFAEGKCDVLCGACRYEYPEGRTRVAHVTRRQLLHLETYDPIHQPSCFWRRELHEAVGGLDPTLQYGMDWDLWVRLARQGARFALTPEVLSVYRMTGSNKTSTGGQARNLEMYRILRRYARPETRLLPDLAYRVLWPLKRLRQGEPRWLRTPLSNTLRTLCLLTFGPMLGFERVRCASHPFS